MPNHVKNIVRMSGITALPLYKTDDDGVPMFDFEKIIPMPQSLMMDAGTMEDIAIEAVIRKIAERRRFEIPKAIPCMSDDEFELRVSKCEETMDEILEMGLQYITNKVRYGATTWYDWSINNWDTKWNAYSNEKIDSDTISFETAWSCPQKVIAQLSKMYPGIEIEHWWADEDTGNNAGYERYMDGRVVDGGSAENGSQEAYDIYVRCWGESNCIYKDDAGEWHHRDCDTCTLCD